MSWLSDIGDTIGGWFGDSSAGSDVGTWLGGLMGSSSSTTPTTTTPTTTTPAVNNSSNSFISSLFSPQAIAAGIGGISASELNDQKQTEDANTLATQEAFSNTEQQQLFEHQDAEQANALANAQGIAMRQIAYETKRDKQNRIQTSYQTAITGNQGANNLTIQALHNLVQGAQAPLQMR